MDVNLETNVGSNSIDGTFNEIKGRKRTRIKDGLEMFLIMVNLLGLKPYHSAISWKALIISTYLHYFKMNLALKMM